MNINDNNIEQNDKEVIVYEYSKIFYKAQFIMYKEKISNILKKI